MAGIEKEEIERIIHATSSPDYQGAPVGSIIQDKLGIKTDIQVFDIAAACTGWGQGLSVAFAFAKNSDSGAQAIIGSEIISPVINPSIEQTYILFGDAAGATIVENVVPDQGAPTKYAFKAGSDGSLLKSLYVPAGGSRLPANKETLEQGLHAIHMDGKVIKEQAIRRMSEVTRAVLDLAGLSVEDIDLFIPHQANLSIIKETADALKVPEEKVMVTIQNYGNTSAASIPTALYEAYHGGRIKRNQYLAFATFGAGLVYIAGVIPMVGLPKKV
jgi:3-oxoacyl-[acyl-carrier-protein] synthase-3